jgi:hypothetical protein
LRIVPWNTDEVEVGVEFKGYDVEYVVDEVEGTTRVTVVGSSAGAGVGVGEGSPAEDWLAVEVVGAGGGAPEGVIVRPWSSNVSVVRIGECAT